MASLPIVLQAAMGAQLLLSVGFSSAVFTTMTGGKGTLPDRTLERNKTYFWFLYSDPHDTSNKFLRVDIKKLGPAGILYVFGRRVNSTGCFVTSGFPFGICRTMNLVNYRSKDKRCEFIRSFNAMLSFTSRDPNSSELLIEYGFHSCVEVPSFTTAAATSAPDESTNIALAILTGISLLLLVIVLVVFALYRKGKICTKKKDSTAPSPDTDDINRESLVSIPADRPATQFHQTGGLASFDSHCECHHETQRLYATVSEERPPMPSESSLIEYTARKYQNLPDQKTGEKRKYQNLAFDVDRPRNKTYVTMKGNPALSPKPVLTHTNAVKKRSRDPIVPLHPLNVIATSSLEEPHYMEPLTPK